MIANKSYLPEAEKRFSVWVEISGLLVAVVTTLITTLLIMYRIHNHSRQNAANREPRYTYILKLLVESSALHLIGLLMLAIPASFPVTNTSVLLVENMNSYAGAFFPFAAVRALVSNYLTQD